MTRIVPYLFAALLLCLFTCPVAAQDMRAAQTQEREARQLLIDKAAAEKQAAAQAAAESRATISRDRTALKRALQALEAQRAALDQTVVQLTAQMEHLTAEEKTLSQRLAESDGVIRELVGVIRVNAKDLLALIEQNLQTAILKTDITFLQAIAGQSRFPGLSDIRKMIGTSRHLY